MIRKRALGWILLATGALMAVAGWSAAPGAVAAGPIISGTEAAGQVIRLHVVANSDSEEDQALKRAVRDAILDEVTPLFVGMTTLDQAVAAVEAALPRIQATAAALLAAKGRHEPVTVDLGKSSFPTKVYGLALLPAGEYTALQIKIGEAEGANWWCVLFPPMCFLDWSTGLVLEPAPGSGGSYTVAVPRGAVALLEGEVPAGVPVKARFAIAEWLKARRASGSGPPGGGRRLP